MADPFSKDTPGRLSQIWNGPSNKGTPQRFACMEYSLHEKQVPGSCQALSIRAEKPLKKCPAISKVSKSHAIRVTQKYHKHTVDARSSIPHLPSGVIKHGWLRNPRGK